MAKKPEPTLLDDSCPFDADEPSVEKPAPIDGDKPLSINNAAKLADALAHLRRVFVAATLPQLGGRPFYGCTTLKLVWHQGECASVNTLLEQTDKGDRPIG